MLRSLSLFGRELLTNPRNIGAACPSSPALAHRIARTVGINKKSHVVELGAGTGSITRALLERCVSGDRLVVLERSASMVALLRKRFPGATVVQGDAGDLKSILHDQLGIDPVNVSHIVSSLPLRSIPQKQSLRIAEVIQDMLSHGSRLVQYTYDLRNGSLGWFDRLGHLKSSYVWLNLPPARVDLFAASRVPSPRWDAATAKPALADVS